MWGSLPNEYGMRIFRQRQTVARAGVASGFAPMENSSELAEEWGVMETSFSDSQPPAGTAILEKPRTNRSQPSRRVEAKKQTRSPLISIVIPAHNEQDYIRRTLEAANCQTFGDFEIVVVANGCTDHTVHAAREFCDRVIVMPERGLSRARNLGAQAARGRILVFLDADTLLEPHALDTIAEKFTPGYAAGTLKGCPDISRPSYLMMYAVKNFQHRLRLHEGSSGVILCWREHFLATGGFDETLHVTENSELISRLRRFGKYTFISDTAVTTSMRRYENGGLFRMICLWVKLWSQSLFSDLRHHNYEAFR
jgi:glycosyltransferase involved in cell wall biosynthesis